MSQPNDASEPLSEVSSGRRPARWRLANESALVAVREWCKATAPVAAIAAIVAVYIAYEQLRNAQSVAQEQVKAVGRQLTLMENDQRPWIRVDAEAIEEFAFRTHESTTYGSTPIKYFVTNVGKTPAFNVEVMTRAFVVGDGRADIDSEQMKWCHHAKTNRSARQKLFVFPNERELWGFHGGVFGTAPHPDEIAKYAKIVDGRRLIQFYIFGCATYDFGRPNSIHQTAFLFQVAHQIKRSDGSITLSLEFDLEERVPKEQIILLQHPSAPDLTN